MSRYPFSNGPELNQRYLHIAHNQLRPVVDQIIRDIPTYLNEIVNFGHPFNPDLYVDDLLDGISADLSSLCDTLSVLSHRLLGPRGCQVKEQMSNYRAAIPWYDFA